MSVCSSHKYVLLAGDFNARTSELRDFTENDEFLADIFYFDSETCNFFSQANSLEPYNIAITRQSHDKHTNNHGYKLIDICKNNNIFILNGRFGNDRGMGGYTFS